MTAGKMVLVNRSNPGINQQSIDKLLEDGVGGLLDYSTGKSADPDDLPSSNRNGRGALNNLAEIAKKGGYAFSHTKGYKKCVIGRISPDSLTFKERTNSKGETKHLKCFKYDRGDYYVGTQADFEHICDEITGFDAGKPLAQPSAALADMIVTRFGEIERKGGL